MQPRTSKGLVTVGVPTFNRAELLRRTLDALLNQDYQHLEIVISDNHSTDATPEVGAEYSRRYDSVRYLRQTRPVPVAENFRTPLRLGCGEFFMWAADDDARMDSFVSTLVRVLNEQPTTVLAAGEAQYRLPDGALLSFFREGSAWYEGDVAISPEARLTKVIRHSYGNLIYGLYRRSALIERDRTTLETWRSLNEIPVFLNVAARGGIQVLPDVLMYKTAPLPVYLAAAREYNALPQESRGLEETPRAMRHLAGVSRQVLAYHAAALTDALRATKSLPLPRSVRARVAARLTAQLTTHGLSTVWQFARSDEWNRKSRRPASGTP